MKTILKGTILGGGLVACLLFDSQIQAQNRQKITLSDKKEYTWVAQEKVSDEEQAQVLTQVMLKELNITDSMYQELYAINLKYTKQNKDITKEYRDNARKLANKLFESQKQKNKELKTILTKDQFKKYDKQRNKIRQKVEKEIIERCNPSGVTAPESKN